MASIIMYTIDNNKKTMQLKATNCPETAAVNSIPLPYDQEQINQITSCEFVVSYKDEVLRNFVP